MPAPSLVEAFGRVALSVQSGLAGAPARIWHELRPWLGELTLHAAVKWLPRMALQLPCQVPVMQGGNVVGACRQGAVAQCDACERTCCLYHGRIDHQGDAICYLCVADAVKRTRQTARGREHATPSTATDGETEKERKWARRTLGVAKDATWDEVRAAYRRQSAKWHPDVHPTPSAKQRAEARFKDVQRAFQILKTQAAAP